MQAKNPYAPKDLMALLEDNLKSGRPLLDDAVLYRGTRGPDQATSSFAPDTMHGTLLSHVAVGYTHNWKEDISFVGTYKVDRETTRFYKDFGLEQHLDGKKVPSMSVKEAEHLLAPFVREYANARPGRERGHAEERLESVIKAYLYESNVPARTADQSPNRPVDLFVYSGRPDIAVRQAVPMQLTKVGPQTEASVKVFTVKNMRNPVINSIHQLSSQLGPAQKALGVLKNIAQRDFSKMLQDEHGHKPLNKMLDDVAKQPLSVQQERIGRLAKALVEGVEHPNPAVRMKANALAFELTQLDGAKATFNDVAKVSAVVSSVYGKPEASVAKSVEAAAGHSPAKTATAETRAPAAMVR